MGSTSLIVLTILLSLLYATLGGYSLYRLFILRSRIKSWIYQQLFFGFMIIFSISCIILHLVRIPLILIAGYREKQWFKSPWEDATFIFCYFFFSELLTASLVIFFIFEIPPKQGKLELVPVESVNEETPILNN
ncbi:hypothetical protein M0812_19681 [Anaeramoeba flamelloides]|uniref:Uncharacterized protein n=1 Tax=Anaeramoeba flamelloides TaxID=1746091 RepID=A0AAV7Z0I5_9EUKA|nr:hypothetical protein M0812_19681 [Anaeramoeba flamelloides]